MTTAIDSVQRYALDWRGTPEALGRAYFTWLDRAWGPLVRVRQSSTEVTIFLLGRPAIRLAPQPPTQTQGRYEVLGGALARPGGVFHFTAPAGEIRFDLLGFRPVLPLWLYRLSHGPVHVWTMDRFARSLGAGRRT